MSVRPRQNAGVLSPFARAMVLAGSVAGATVGASAAEEILRGRQDELAAEAAVARGEWRDAIGLARAAAEARVPDSPWPGRATNTLLALARSADARGDARTAVLARDALRTAAVATHSAAEGGAGGGPGADRRPADGAIAILSGSAVAVLLGVAAMTLAQSRGAPARSMRIAQFATAAGVVAYTAVLLMR